VTTTMDTRYSRGRARDHPRPDSLEP